MIWLPAFGAFEGEAGFGRDIRGDERGGGEPQREEERDNEGTERIHGLKKAVQWLRPG